VPERRYREGLEGIPGHVAAGRLLNGSYGSQRAAWAKLGIFDLDTADEYLTDLAKAALNKGSESEQIDGIIEVAELFALTAVLADRERRQEDAEHEERVQARQAAPPPDPDDQKDDIPF
jgi:hypothetical protein